MKINFLPRQLYKKLWLVFTGVIFTLGLLQFFSINAYFKKFTDERLQRKNWNLAADIAEQLRPFIEQKDFIGFRRALKNQETLLFGSTIAFFGGDGRILEVAENQDKPALKMKYTDSYVGLGPVRDFLTPTVNRQLPLYNNTIGGTGFKSVFSVAPFEISGQPGFIYVEPHGQWTQILSLDLQTRSIILGGILLQVAIVVLVGLLGSALFFLVARRFKTLVSTVDRIAKGELSARVPATGNDEITQLGTQINEMADQIVSNIDQLKAADFARRQLVAMVSHDLGGPITSIQAHLQSLLEQGHSRSPEKVDEYLRISMNTAEQLTRLIRSLFELSKLEASDIPIERTAFSILDTVSEEILPNLEQRATEAGITLGLDCPEQLPLVVGDLEMIERVLSNLIENGIRYGNSGGEVRVKLEPLDQLVRIEVYDNGPGIPQEDLPHIFEPFFRSGAAKDFKKGSSGLGLAIVKKMVELHDQTITVRSELGVGTSFSFSLPQNERSAAQ